MSIINVNEMDHMTNESGHDLMNQAPNPSTTGLGAGAPPPSIHGNVMTPEREAIQQLQAQQNVMAAGMQQILSLLAPLQLVTNGPRAPNDNANARVHSSAGRTPPVRDHQASRSEDEEEFEEEQIPKGMKIPTPMSFNGRFRKHSELLGWFYSVDRFLDLYKVNPDRPLSLSLTCNFLSDAASQWYENARRANSSAIKSWKQLKDALRKQYINESLVELERDKLMKMELGNSEGIGQFNVRFNDTLCMLPEAYEESSFTWIKQCYLKGIGNAHESITLYLLSVKDNTEVVKTITDLQNEALKAEGLLRTTAVLGGRKQVGGKRGVSYLSQALRKGMSQNQSREYGFRSPSNQGFRTPNSSFRSFASSNSNSSPGATAALHHLDGCNEDEDDVSEEVSETPEKDESESDCLEESELQHMEEQGSQEEEMGALLNALQAFEKAKKRDPKLTAKDFVANHIAASQEKVREVVCWNCRRDCY
jgi:hypothetical protein